MARPAKAVSVTSGVIKKEDKEARRAIENAIKGGGGELLVPPDDMTESQREIFMHIRDSLSAAQILGEIHVYALTRLAIIIDRLNYLEDKARKTPSLIYDKQFISAQHEYNTQFVRLCNEFCLTPQSMAKMAVSTVKAVSKKQTLSSLLQDDDDE